MTMTFENGDLRLNPGPIARLTLDRPDKHNAMTAAMWEAIPGICDKLIVDKTRVLIVTGDGAQAFCAGAGDENVRVFEIVYVLDGGNSRVVVPGRFWWWDIANSN